MKIEKINDRQIRCTLTREDLASRELKLSELAYGSDKAKALFQDMMQLAARDFGFEADNIPLMIEAIPVSMDTIVLIITKVEDPDELDTRFAKFTPEDSEPDDDFSLSSLRDKIEGADDVLGLIRKITEAKKQAAAKAAAKKTSETAASDSEQEDPQNAAETEEELRNLTRFYLFHSLDDAITAAGVLGSAYDGPNTLYKNPENGQYYLNGNAEASAMTKVDIAKKDSTVTLYVTEVDEEGNPIAGAAGFKYEVSVDQTKVDLTAERSKAVVVITNKEVPETESETQPTTKPTKGVKTGDDTPIGGYAGLMAIAFAAFALLVVSEQKRRKSGRE